jgi:acyl-CoA synthetase (AMP-forming)/AMP-acid ligase II
LPLTHGLGTSLAYMALSSGGRIVLTERFSADDSLRLIGEERITVLNGTPTHFILLTNRLDRARHDVSSLRTGVGSAASFPPPLLRRIFDDLGMDFLLMYGSSEGVGVSTTDKDDMLRGAVGRPVPGFVAIVGPDRDPVPGGEIGEIAFNRDFAEVEYWRDSAGGAPPTPGPAPNGRWYYSGDLGRMDEQGRLYLLGRLKHQIDRGGLKIDPGEIEQALMRVPGLLDAAVIGMPNPVLGEIVCACVVPGPGGEPALTGLRHALGAELAPHKLPEELALLDAIPRTALGKVDRAALREAAAAAPRRERLRAG